MPEGSVDRHDNVRVYVRRRGRRRRILDWSSAATFMAEYRNLRDGPVPSAPARRAPAARDSIRWLCERYYDSAVFHSFSGSVSHPSRPDSPPLRRRGAAATGRLRPYTMRYRTIRQKPD